MWYHSLFVVMYYNLIEVEQLKLFNTMESKGMGENL